MIVVIAMRPKKLDKAPSSTPEAAKRQTEFVQQICDEVRTVVQTPQVVKLIVDSIIESVTKIVVERLQETLDFNGNEVCDLKEEIKNMDNEINALNEKIAEMEQYQRRDNLRIFGIPESRNEDTDQLALKVFNDRLGVQLDLSDVSRSHRVGPNVPGKPRPIIVKFTNYRPRSKVFRAKRKLKGTGITVKEDLCYQRLQLLRAATEKHGYKNVFSQDGKIVVVKDSIKHFITTKSELAGL